MSDLVSGAASLPRELVLASAGTGKTFRISSRIIGLLAAGESADSIFASTFTRKAAGEILDRVLARLAGAALDPSEAAALAEHAALSPQALGEWTSERWLALLVRTLTDLHRLDVGTLDAFFVRAATSFADELGLPPGWTIADRPTADRARAEALHAVLRNADPGELTELVREVEGRDAARSVHDAILRRAESLLAIHASLAPEATDAWGGFDALAAAVPADLGARQTALAAAFRGAEIPTTSKGQPDGNWQRAVHKIANQLLDGAWAEVVCEKFLKSARADGTYYGKPISLQLKALSEEVIQLARAVLARRFAVQSAALRRLSEQLSAAMESTRRELGAFEFGDVTRVLGGANPLCARPDLPYRLDSRVRNILLDEFQDTSLPQWEALAAMLDGVLGEGAGGGAAVVVADPKQSIYGWRGGEPLLVRYVGDRYGLTSDELSMSWRSSPVVLDLVNRVFAGLAVNEMFEEDEVARRVAEEWSDAFALHSAAKPDLPGHVRVLAGPEEATRGDDRPLLCRRAARLVAELHAEAPHLTIGVLTRRNPAVARIMLELRELGVAASEEGGNPLTDSAAVSAVLALFRLADHPGNVIARYHVARTPLGALFDLTDHRDGRGARRAAHVVRSRLLGLGYGRTLREVAERIDPLCDARDRRRLAQLVEMGFRYDERATLRCTDFVRLVESERVEDPTAAQVRVMTIHQSKGLEFDIIVLPELDLSMTKGKPDPLTYRPEPTGRVTRVFPYISKDVRALFPDLLELQGAAEQAMAARWRDALSGLYVALTRARHAVHIFVRGDAEGKGKAKSAARLVRGALGADGPAPEGKILFESGDPLWYRTLPPPPARETAGQRTGDTRATVGITLRTTGPGARTLPRVTPSALAGGPGVDLRGLLRLEREAADRGTLAHAWFETIGWLEEGAPADGHLRALAVSAAPDLAMEAIETLRARFRSWLDLPDIRYLLLRSSYPASAEVEREVPFLHRADGRMVEGTIDRLILVRRDGKVVAAEVIDFKTDALAAGDPDALTQRVRRYVPQLDAYRAAVRNWYGLPADAVKARLVFVDAGAVVEV